MQKYADLQTFGDKLKIISAYAVEHVKGHFFIEAEKQSEVTEVGMIMADVNFLLHLYDLLSFMLMFQLKC